MIHTATLTYRPDKSTFNRFISSAGTYFQKQENQYVNRKYKEHGIVITASISSFDDYTIYLFICRINFKRLIEKEDRLAVYTDTDYGQMARKFNAIMVYLGGLPFFDNWNTHRIDYCVNIKTPYVKEYIALMQKGDIPAWQRQSYNPSSKRYTHMIGSVYLPSKSRNIKQNKTGSITINFYNKYQELAAESIKNKEITEPQLSQAKDILRLEVQCHRPKLDSIKRKYSLENKKITHYLSPQISFDVLESAILKVCKKGDYCRKSVALEKIDNEKGLHDSTKNNLKMILTEVNRQHQSISKARDNLVAAGRLTKHKFNQLLSKLDELNINPVTISDNKSIDGISQKEGLLNIYNLFFETFNQ